MKGLQWAVRTDWTGEEISDGTRYLVALWVPTPLAGHFASDMGYDVVRSIDSTLQVMGGEGVRSADGVFIFTRADDP